MEENSRRVEWVDLLKHFDRQYIKHNNFIIFVTYKKEGGVERGKGSLRLS